MKKSQVVAMPESETPQVIDDQNLSQKGMLNDLEKTGTRYAAGFNVNKDEVKSPGKKNSTENEN